MRYVIKKRCLSKINTFYRNVSKKYKHTYSEELMHQNVDEAALRDMRPDLDTTAAIRLWAQELVDHRIQQMRIEDEETMSIDDALEMTLAAVREEW